MRNSVLKSRCLQSAAILIATVSAASAQNVTAANVNVLNLLSPFLSLNASAIGQTTLTDNIERRSPSITPLPCAAGALLQRQESSGRRLQHRHRHFGRLRRRRQSRGRPAEPAGRLGRRRGRAVSRRPRRNPRRDLRQRRQRLRRRNHTALPNTVALLTSAYNFTSSDLGVAKFYFANGTTNGTAAAVAPSGFTLPTYNGLPNPTNSVYDIAYGVSNTDPSQNIYGNSRPVQVTSVDHTWVNQRLRSDHTRRHQPPIRRFPSGHTNYAFTDSILIGMLVPQLYQSMLVARRPSTATAASCSASTIRSTSSPAARSPTYDLAQGFTNPAYINNAATTGTAINLPSLYTAAQPELTGYLSTQLRRLGRDLRGGASRTPTGRLERPNAAIYASNLTYGLPTLSFAKAPRSRPRPAAPTPRSCSPRSTAAARALRCRSPRPAASTAALATSTINQIIVNTEGHALSGLLRARRSATGRASTSYAAIGYFRRRDRDANDGERRRGKTDVTVASGGVVNVTGLFKVDGKLPRRGRRRARRHARRSSPVTDYSQVEVGKAADLEGALDVMLGNGFALGVGETFDLVTTLGGLTDKCPRLVFDGAACSALGGSRYSCADGGRNDVISLLVTGGGDDLTLRVDAVPEPATWAMMLIAGFAGLGFRG